MARTPALLAAALLFPTLALAQYPDPMGNDGFGQPRRADDSLFMRTAPVITNSQLRGPVPPAELAQIMTLSEAQQTEYRQVFDSSMAATREYREAAQRRFEQLGQAVGRDSAAVDYYRERLKELGKTLKDAQSRFDDRVKKFLSKDQFKQYREWHKKQEKEELEGGRPREFGRPPAGRRP
jgi:Spy/CpxP family protein refolding chaperone